MSPWISTVLSLTDNLFTYMNKKDSVKYSKKFYALKTAIELEERKPIDEKDNALLDDLYDDLFLFVNSFSKDIKTKKVPK